MKLFEKFFGKKYLDWEEYQEKIQKLDEAWWKEKVKETSLRNKNESS